MNSTRKLLTIITEAALESTLPAELKRLGAHGYTITDARGSGSRGARNASWEPSGNIRIEVVCDTETANTISNRLKERYYDNYAMILFTHDVEVLRPQKF